MDETRLKTEEMIVRTVSARDHVVVDSINMFGLRIPQLQCVAIKTAVVFFENLPKSTGLAGIITY